MSESTTLPRLSLITALLLSLFTTHAQVQSLVNRDWVTTGGTPNGLYDFQASHVDVSGNIVVVGNTYHYGQMENYLISKYGAGGDLQFRREYDGLASSTDFATDVTTEGKNTYVTGVEGDTAAGVTYITTQKLDSVGNVIWTSRYQNSYKKYNLGFRIITDPSGTSLYVCGTSQTTPTDFALTVIKYSTAGTQAWVATYDSVGLYDAAVDMKVSGTNLIVYGISGVSSTSGDFITRSYSTSSCSLTGQSRVSASGAYIAKPIGIAKDRSENIYFTGVVKNGTTGSDIQIVKLDSTLTLKWAKTIDGGYSKNDEVAAIKIDSRNNIILTGFAANADTSKAIWTIKMKDSVIVWNKKRLCPISGQDAKGADVDLDVNNNIYVTGKVYNGANYDNITIGYDTLGNTKWEQVYTMSLAADDEGRNIKVDSGGYVYVYGRSSVAGGSYTYTTQKYQQDSAFTPIDSALPVLPWAYYANQGQVIDTGTHQASYVYYYTNTSNPRFYVCDQELSYVFASHDSLIDSVQRIDIKLVQDAKGHAPAHPIYYSSEQVAPYLNYYIGGLPKYYENVKGSQRLTAKNVYPDIDFQLYSDTGGLKYYYVVNPGGTPSDIEFQYSGADSTRVDSNAITVFSKYGQITQLPFTAWQYGTSNSRVPVTLTCTKVASNTYQITVGSYTTTKPLIIGMKTRPRPTATRASDNLNWSTYLGGSGIDGASAIDIDNDGNQYITGNSSSTQFPTSSGYIVGSNHTGSFISRFNTDNSLAWSSYYGGTVSPSLTSSHQTNAISVGVKNDYPDIPVYIGGTTAYTNLLFPTWSYIPTAYQVTSNPGGYADMFLARFDGFTGALRFATLIGSTAYDELNTLKVDRSNNYLYVGGGTESSSFPYGNSYSGNFYDSQGLGIIIQFDNNLNKTWATGIGSPSLLFPGDDIGHGCSVKDLTFDVSHNLVVVGQSMFAFPTTSPYNITQPSGSYTQAHLAASGYSSTPYNGFLAKLTQHSTSLPNQFDLYYFSEFGGSGENNAFCVTTDVSNNIYIGGPVYSTVSLFPFKNPGSGAYFSNTLMGSDPEDAYVAMFDATGIQKWTTLIGDGTYINSLAVDNNKTLYCFGQTWNLTTGLPLTSKAGYYYDNVPATIDKCFIASFTNSHVKDWVTFFGGNGAGEVPGKCMLWNNTNLYICGETTTDQNASDPYPLRYVSPQYNQPYGGFFDAFIANFSVSSTPTSILEVSGESNINVMLYPNPNNGDFNIYIDEPIEGASLKIYNSIGDLVCDRHIENDQTNIKLNNLADGIYIASLENNGKRRNSKFIVFK